MPKPRQPIHAINAHSAAEVVPLRSSVVSCAICGSARASASTPASLIQFPASRAHRSCPSAPFAAHIQHLPLPFPHPQSRDPTNDSANPCPSLGSPFMLSSRRALARSCRQDRASSAAPSAAAPAPAPPRPRLRSVSLRAAHTAHASPHCLPPTYTVRPRLSHDCRAEAEQMTRKPIPKLLHPHSCHQGSQRRRSRT